MQEGVSAWPAAAEQTPGGVAPSSRTRRRWEAGQAQWGQGHGVGLYPGGQGTLQEVWGDLPFPLKSVLTAKVVHTNHRTAEVRKGVENTAASPPPRPDYRTLSGAARQTPSLHVSGTPSVCSAHVDGTTCASGSRGPPHAERARGDPACGRPPGPDPAGARAGCFVSFGLFSDTCMCEHR